MGISVAMANAMSRAEDAQKEALKLFFRETVLPELKKNDWHVAFNDDDAFICDENGFKVNSVLCSGIIQSAGRFVAGFPVSGDRENGLSSIMYALSGHRKEAMSVREIEEYVFASPYEYGM